MCCQAAALAAVGSPQLPNPAASQDKVEALLEQLGDSDFSAREQAEKALRALGRPALEPLRQLLNHQSELPPDNEIRLRAARLLVLMEREDYARRVSAFVQGDEEEVLPGWSRFRAITSDTPAARKLYVAVNQAAPELCRWLAPSDTKPSEEKLREQAKRELLDGKSEKSNEVVGEISAFLFFASQDFETDQGRTQLPTRDDDVRLAINRITQPRFRKFIESSGAQSEVELLMSSWMKTLAQDDKHLVAASLDLILAFELAQHAKEVLQIAANQTFPTSLRVDAIVGLVKLKASDAVDGLSALIVDTTFVGNFLGPASGRSSESQGDSLSLLNVQVGDIALAAAIVLSGQRVEDFGFPSAAVEDGELDPNLTGFRGEAQRKAAVAAWVASQQKK